MIDFCNNIYCAMGSDNKKFLKSERILHSILTRRMLAKKKIKAGAKVKSF